MDTTTTLVSINELDAVMHQYAPTLVDPEDENMAAMLMAFTNDDWEGLGEFSALAKKAIDPVITQVVSLESPSSATTSLGAVVELDLTESPPALSNRQLSADSGLGTFPSSSPKTPEYHPIPVYDPSECDRPPLDDRYSKHDCTPAYDPSEHDHTLVYNPPPVYTAAPVYNAYNPYWEPVQHLYPSPWVSYRCPALIMQAPPAWPSMGPPMPGPLAPSIQPAREQVPNIKKRTFEFVDPTVPQDFVANPNNHGRWQIDAKGNRHYLNAPKVSKISRGNKQ